MKSSHCCNPGPPRHSKWAFGVKALGWIRWGIPLLLFMMSGCSGKKDQPAAKTNPLGTRTWKVPADFLDHLSNTPLEPLGVGEEGDPSPGEGCVFWHSLPVMLEQQFSIPFPDGTTTEFSPNRGELIVKNSEANLEMIDKLLKSSGEMEMFVLDEDLFSPLQTLVFNGGPFPSGAGKQQWRVGAEVMDALIARSYYVEEGPPDPFAEEKSGPKPKEEPLAREGNIRELLLRNGLEISPGGSVIYDKTSGILTSVNEEENTLYTEMLFLNAAISISKGKSQKEPGSSISGRSVPPESPAKNEGDPPSRKP